MSPFHRALRGTSSQQLSEASRLFIGFIKILSVITPEVDQTRILRGLGSLHNWQITTRVSFLCIGSENETLVGGRGRGVSRTFLLALSPALVPVQFCPWNSSSRCRKSKLYTHHSDAIKKFDPSSPFHLAWVKTKTKKWRL